MTVSSKGSSKGGAEPVAGGSASVTAWCCDSERSPAACAGLCLGAELLTVHKGGSALSATNFASQKRCRFYFQKYFCYGSWSINIGMICQWASWHSSNCHHRS